MTDKMIKINNKFYKQPHIDLLDRNRVKKLKPLLAELEAAEDMDSLYTLAGFMLTETPEKDVDKLLLGDVKHILADAGIAKFDDIGSDKSRISVGESSASTDS